MPSHRGLYDLDLPELQALLEGWNEPSYRARQVWEWLYGHLAASCGEMTNLPLSLREEIESQIGLYVPRRLSTQMSSDGETRKDLLQLTDGETIEVVLMRYARRRTACVSTQVGCAVGCAFCATGQAGFQRDLSAGEIVAQVLHVARLLRDEGDRLTNVVLMGMGEPLLNYDATLTAIHRLIDPDGFKLGQRRITVSTVGIVPGIDRLAGEKAAPRTTPLQVTLAVSLHASTDELREKLVPVNRRYPLDALFAACRRYTARTDRRLTFEWALIAGVNDSQQQAEGLANRLSGLHAHVNLIPLNPTPAYPNRPSTRRDVSSFAAVLERHGIPFTVRLRRGIDIQAGCGQLRHGAARAGTEVHE